tara:strand:+ start:172 stop:876 length:705 start_codon:yes stop_codon:yes gene_type:complete
MNPDEKDFLNKVIMPLFDPNAVDDPALPLWVCNIIKHFHGTGINKLLEIVKNHDFDSYGIGLMAGSAKHIETMLETLPEVKKEILDLMKGTELDKKLEQAEEKFTELKDFTGDYEQEISKGSNHEESTYLLGKSEGLQSIIDQDGQIKGAKDNTKLLGILYLIWPCIDENCSTRRELYDFLLKSFWKPKSPEDEFDILMAEAVPPKVLGSYERVEKLLKRIGFNPAAVGRPKNE